MRRPFRVVLPIALVAAALTLSMPILKGATLAPGAWTFPGIQAEWFGVTDRTFTSRTVTPAAPLTITR